MTVDTEMGGVRWCLLLAFWWCAATSVVTAAEMIDARDHGVRGDGVADDTPGIRAALAAAEKLPAPAGVRFPAGRFRYTGLIEVKGIEIEGEGGTATVFEATDRMNSAWRMTGAGPALRNLGIHVLDASEERETLPTTAGIDVVQASDFAIERVRITNTASAGILVRGGAGAPDRMALIMECEVEDTLADGIHVTGGSRRVRIIGNRVRRSGDDFIAVVSYRDAGQPCREIEVIDNDVAEQEHGRGISVVGGSGIILESNRVQGTAGAGIYVASESTYGTFPVEHVLIRGNEVGDTGRVTAMGHAAIQLAGHESPESADAGMISDVRVEANRIAGSTRDAIRVGPYARRVAVAENIIADVRENAVGIGPNVADVTVGGADGVAASNLVSSCGGYGVYVDTRGATGGLLVAGNRFEAVNTRSRRYVDVIHLSRGGAFASAEIAGNHYNQSPGAIIDRFIESHVSGLRLADNTTNVEVRIYQPPEKQPEEMEHGR